MPGLQRTRRPLRLAFTVRDEERTHVLTGDRVRLGRGEDNDLVLPDVSVSRHHAELRIGSVGWSIHDVGSTNGIELNRAPVRSAPIQPGDRLTIGAFELLVEGGELELPEPASSRPAGAAAAATDPPPSAPLANATILRSLADWSATYGLGPAEIAAGIARGTGAVPGAGGATFGSIPGAPATGERRAPDEFANRMFGYLTRLGRELITAEGVDEVLARVFDIAFEALPIDRGFILLRDDAGELVCEMARFKDRAELRPAGEVPVSRTMLHEVMSQRVALVTYDALSDQRLAGGGAFGESIRLHQIRAAMCAPLWSGESILGVVQVDSPVQVGAFAARDLDFLTALANFVAVAVERLRYAAKAEFEREVRSRLERYHSPALIEEVLREEDGSQGVRRARAVEATVLFADLVGFTAFAERASPEEVSELLEAYLTLAVDAIFAAGGTLDKFIGDCAMAFFGAPVPQADHALRAVRAAVDIQRSVADLSARRTARGLAPLAARVGINSGPVIVGDIGSSRRVDYTVLGNTVNVAARLESAVARPGDVVLGPETHRLLGEAVPTEPLGEHQLKGLQQKITAYRVR